LCSLQKDIVVNGERITNRVWFGDEHCRDNELIPGMILTVQDIIKKKDE
jgi:hypothetical protein